MTRSIVRWLIPIAALVLLACSISAGVPPATLQVNPPTITALALGAPWSTPTLATSATLARPNDPEINALLDQVQSDRLMLAVGTLADLRSRHVLSKPTNTIGGIARARDWLLAEFNAIRNAHPNQPISVWTQDVPFTWKNVPVNAQNVVAVFQGNDIGAGVIVVGAHYDSISADFTNGQAYAPGANDNGSGVAALLEIARILAPQSHRATVVFVAFAAEETGRQGSMAFVKSYLQAQNPPIAVRGMINLDIIGSELGANGEVDSRTIRLFSADPNDSPSRQLARQIAVFANAYLDDVNMVVQSAEERTGRWGDHQSFSAAGYPSVRLIQGLEDLSRQHTPRDTVDNVQPAYLMRTTRAALVAVSLLADGPASPVDFALRPATTDPNVQILTWKAVSGAGQYLVALRQKTSLFYDQLFTVDATAPGLTLNTFGRYATVAIATIDSTGQMGPLSPEVPIAALVGK